MAGGDTEPDNPELSASVRVFDLVDLAHPISLSPCPLVYSYPSHRRLQRSSRLMTANIRNDAVSMTVAIAVASAYWNSSSLFTTNTAAISGYPECCSK